MTIARGHDRGTLDLERIVDSGAVLRSVLRCGSLLAAYAHLRYHHGLSASEATRLISEMKREERLR